MQKGWICGQHAMVKKDWTVSTFPTVNLGDSNGFQDVSATNTAIQLSTKAVHSETLKIVDAQLGDMARQMSTLDEFVMRVRDQNDKSHEQHISRLLQFQFETTQLQADLGRAIEEQETGLQSLEDDSKFAVTALPECTSSFCTDVEEGIATIQEQVRSTSPKDYVPTGETPQKKSGVIPQISPQLPITGLSLHADEDFPMQPVEHQKYLRQADRLRSKALPTHHPPSSEAQ
ncbi:MAG: hypothetical protein L6R35_001334 [Caloplaca aegaea]|nr:MAG: hypothetical protein L6R35_001334 [Caloplaca aegaea]